MLAGDCWNHYCNLSENEKLLFLSGKEGVVAFFTRRWYQFKQSLKFYALTIVIRVPLAAIFQAGLVFYGLYVGVVLLVLR
jgi:hypothetical protein